MSSFLAQPKTRLLALWLALLTTTYLSPAAAAEDADAPPEIWLVTYGPGEIYWQRFGHNAIWVRKSSLGLDHVFNFGFFDFAQEDFFLRFLLGRMLYFSAAQRANDEFAAYIDENRSIRAQQLDLSPEQAWNLTDFLLREIQTENRDYLYDYYRNNCSTRVRDALDMALGGTLKHQFDNAPAQQTWRDHTRRLTAADFWLYLGLEIALGAPVDRPISRWEEMFIPARLADALTGFEVARNGVNRPLVLEDIMLFDSTLPAPPARPAAWWPRYLLASLGFLAIITLLCRVSGPAWGWRLARAWFALAGVGGFLLLFLWFGTDHIVARQNLNVLVFCPLWLWPALRPPGRGLAWPLATLLSALALLMAFLPPWQYTFDVLAAFVPLNLASGFLLRRR